MGYQVYHVSRHDRFCGYGVPAVYEHPDCNEEIDRGLAHVCGGEPAGHIDGACGLYFCGKHLSGYIEDQDNEMRAACERCEAEEEPFEPKPDTDLWVSFMLVDDSWQGWRDENPEKVNEMLARIPLERARQIVAEES